ncbi:MAG: DUF58 domain-containing protein [Myxococcota bacterium]|nr:DUF58 domain-containing protein [Myxococcota bacterium]
MKRGSSHLIDPELLGRLATATIKMRRRVEGHMTGRHRSPHQGASVEFSQYREYVPGDDIRHVDWKAYARSDRYYIKQFEDETNLRAHLILDSSGSMGFSHQGRETKFRYACKLAAAMAWCFLRQGDAVGLIAYSHRMEKHVAPSTQANHFWSLVDHLTALSPQGETSLVGALLRVAELAGRRSQVIILSDCLDFDQRFTGLARQLTHRAHEVTVLHILDRAEIEFPYQDVTRFEGMEEEDTLTVDPRAMRREYLTAIEKWREGLRIELREGRVNYVPVTTDQSIEKVIYGWLGDHHQ